MRARPKSPSYLVRNPHSYCFRMVVPKDLQKFVGKKELRYTLGTGCAGNARQQARFVAGKVHFIFRILRRGVAALKKMTDNQIKDLIDQYIKRAVKSWNESFYEDVDKDEYPLPYVDENTFHGYLGDLDNIREDLVANLNLGDFSMLKASIHALLKTNGITDPDTNSPEYRKLSAEIHKAEIQLLPFQKRHMLCDFSYKKELPEVFPGVFTTPSQSIPERSAQSSETLQKVFKEYWEENLSSWKPRSVTEYSTCHKRLLEFLGHDQMIHSVDWEHGREYKKLLSDTITNRKKPMSPARVDFYLGYAAQVFDWAIKHHYTEMNPFTGLQYGKKKRKRADKQREAYSLNDIKKLFVESRYFGEDKWDKCVYPHFFWIPLLGLHTGARLEELGQLYVDDVKIIEDIVCLDINQNRPDQSVKTGEERIIPVHDFLINELNFMGYVQSLPQDGRLFPELKRVANRYTHGFTMWFSAFSKRCGVVGNKSFHSFRHLVASLLLENDVSEYRIEQLLGHVSEGQTTGRYGKKFKPKMLKEKVVDNTFIWYRPQPP